MAEQSPHYAGQPLEAATTDTSSTITLTAWLALGSACLGWMFDSMDLNLFTLILFPTVSDLIGSSDSGSVAAIGGAIVAIKLFAWGLGGILFGVVADRIGRSRTMIITILIYAIFTGLSGLSRNWIELAVLQAIAGIGIGGEWAAGAALVAETWPEKSRTKAQQFMQMCFAFGNFCAAGANILVGPYGWRWVFLVGATPAILTLLMRRWVPEPERWRHVRAAQKGTEGDSAKETFLAIFRPDFRRRTIVGVVISMAMMIGSWGGLVLLPTWVYTILGPTASAGTKLQATSQVFLIMNIGAVAGYVLLIWLVDWIGRRPSYFVFCLGAYISSVVLFTQAQTYEQLLFFVFFLGFFANGGFGTFAIYLPELYPTRFRATGQGFCWNVARMVTGIGPFVTGMLVSTFGSVPYASLGISWVFVLGLIAIWFGPETRGRALPD
jgi:MFS family permease